MLIKMDPLEKQTLLDLVDLHLRLHLLQKTDFCLYHQVVERFGHPLCIHCRARLIDYCRSFANQHCDRCKKPISSMGPMPLRQMLHHYHTLCSYQLIEEMEQDRDHLRYLIYWHLLMGIHIVPHLDPNRPLRSQVNLLKTQGTPVTISASIPLTMENKAELAKNVRLLQELISIWPLTTVHYTPTIDGLVYSVAKDIRQLTGPNVESWAVQLKLVAMACLQEFF